MPSPLANPVSQESKIPHVYLYTGKEIDVKYSHGMWRCSIAGNNYCGSTFESLLETIGFFHSVYTSFDKPLEVVDPVVQDIAILCGAHSLEERQKALRRLSYRGHQHPLAVEAVRKITEKPVSFGADYITRTLGKKDFSEVRTEEIFDLVPKITHREELILELAERVKL